MRLLGNYRNEQAAKFDDALSIIYRTIVSIVILSPAKPSPLHDGIFYICRRRLRGLYPIGWQALSSVLVTKSCTMTD